MDKRNNSTNALKTDDETEDNNHQDTRTAQIAKQVINQKPVIQVQLLV